MVLSVTPYAVMMCLLGVMRGAGLQAYAAMAIACAFYLVGLPVSAFLGLNTDLQLEGIWLGNVVGLTLAALIMICRLMFVNWADVVELQRVRQPMNVAWLLGVPSGPGQTGNATAPTPRAADPRRQEF